MYYLYTLNTPDTKLPFYVGMTNDPNQRLRTHINKSHNKAVLHFINGMVDYGRVPTMSVIAEFDDKEECEAAELEKIQEYSKKMVILNVVGIYPEGDRLSNVTPSLCCIGRRCKDRENCSFCQDIYVSPRMKIISDSISRGDHVYRVNIRDWNTAKKQCDRNGLNGDYIKITTMDYMYIVTKLELSYDLMERIELSETQIREMLIDKNGRNHFRGSYSLTNSNR